MRFTARSEPRPGSSVLLTFTVEDSGIGIRAEDMEKLFDKFSRLEVERNAHILGMGLGLPIARRLCNAMGGDVTVKSEYGVGSVFTATLVQEVADAAPMGWGLNARASAKSEPSRARFTAPGFRVLAVDDISTNLAIVGGLLAPYKMDVRVCESGAEAVELARKKQFDLIFMDHMMPGMDGIETTKAIRALGESFAKLPIVALTANAVPGMREMFLENGFDDFLPKPIETSKLREQLEKWIPEERRTPVEKESDLAYKVERVKGRIVVTLGLREKEDGKSGGGPLEIEGVDAVKGLALCGGSPAAYRKVLELYQRDAEAKMKYLSASYAESDLKNFTIHVHGLKSSSANVGAAGLSKMAEFLEEAGKAGDMASIRERADAFQQALSDVCARVRAALPAENQKKNRNFSEPSELVPRLKTLKEALEAQDMGMVDGVLAELSKASLSPETEDVLSEISDLVLTAEFEKAIENLRTLPRG